MKDKINGAGGKNVGGNSVEIQLRDLGSPDHVHVLMENLGWEPKVSPNILMAALDLAGKSFNHGLLMNQARQFFRQNAVLVPKGIETVPAAWLKELPDLLLRTLKTHWKFVPYMITGLRFQDGVLCISFAQEEPRVEKPFTLWDQLRVTINRSVCPNLWKELTPQEKAKLCETRSDLGCELLRLSSSDNHGSAAVFDGESNGTEQDTDY